ncbi:phenylalanyl-tRNA synthetase, alpha subunit [Coriobacterium glomerans PW2]|uniref:Phenylalanine--tRNA ligase alpha subunit n=1 Tax=Coriobacterium glomerans (strain ATCC 49209 / DSM 20642 / JCM 10262 / PW2) TaxID=700015 RepID=F2N8Y7_CORGP|nr:phenylalanine--tRNA ligase subunit alpha [Coriobacterium glomerans]AEB07587.1 phenylalanyl-tRNA synthetase, alpha subunit [Coriobacterium glomerans PW2]
MGLIEDLEGLEQRARQMVEDASDAEALSAARVALLGRKGEITAIMHLMGTIDASERPAVGKRANEVRSAVEAMIERRAAQMKREALAATVEREAVDITLPGARPRIGHRHLITQIVEEIEDLFCALGYTVEHGTEVETSYYNFTALNAPMDHPSRSARDTFYIQDQAPGTVEHAERHAHGESDILLRTQTSGVQIHTMETQRPPIYMISSGTVFRPDTIDACHLPQFTQIEGLVVDRGISFADLKGTLDHFARTMFGSDRRVRYRPHFFPFTEPSTEMDVSCNVCAGEGCAFCKHTGWIEIFGCGMVDPNVLINCGVDPEEYSGFAFGIGAERVAALRFDVPGLRPFVTGDMRFLEQF